MLEPNDISAGIATFVATSILLAFMYFSNNERFSHTFTKLDNLLYKKLYYPIYKTITYIFVIMFVFLLYSPFMAEYPKKITFYVCDASFVECVIPSQPESMRFFTIPYPYNREKFLKRNSHLIDHTTIKDMRRIEGYFKEYPYSF
jgi:predicted membrane protein